jgi:hypothetical protein
MKHLFSKLLFDEKDLELLRLVEDVLRREDSRKRFKDLLNPYLNPHGIKEMAASQGFRIAYAMINLLRSPRQPPTVSRASSKDSPTGMKTFMHGFGTIRQSYASFSTPTPASS